MIGEKLIFSKVKNQNYHYESDTFEMFFPSVDVKNQTFDFAVTIMVIK